MFEEARAGIGRSASDAPKPSTRQVSTSSRLEQLAFTTREALESITINGAHAMWLGDQVGSLTPGKKADVILLRATI